MAADILDKQLPNGGWSIWQGMGASSAPRVEAYLALKMAGRSAEDPACSKPGSLSWPGGRPEDPGLYPHLPALFGQVSWDGIPLLPVEFIAAAALVRG